jgi:alpha-methylacyl-CoA racemase
MPPQNKGPLSGLKVLELAGLAPGPFCGLLLSTYGASVLRIDRPSPSASGDLLTAGKTSVAIDLKNPKSKALFLTLAATADILIDPYRPGVLEKLGLDPTTVLLRANPKLIVVQMTGFRRDGKYSAMAGHDINYLAVSGLLSMLGAAGAPPSPPINVLADFAGGGHIAFTGCLLALIQRGVTGKGQVVHANMADGATFLGTFPRLGQKFGGLDGARGTNLLDGGCPYYGCYECKDSGRWMSVGALEPQFFKVLMQGLGLSEKDILPEGVSDRGDKRGWGFMRGVFTRRFKEKTRREWEEVFDGTDACCAPVLEFGELEREGYELRPMVTLTQTPGSVGADPWNGAAMKPGTGGEETLKEWMGWRVGRDFEEVEGALVEKGRSRL